VVRHRLVRDIILAFDEYHARQEGDADDGVGASLEKAPDDAVAESAPARPEPHNETESPESGPSL
jgi:hypothetical protein